MRRIGGVKWMRKGEWIGDWGAVTQSSQWHRR